AAGGGARGARRRGGAGRGGGRGEGRAPPPPPPPPSNEPPAPAVSPAEGPRIVRTPGTCGGKPRIAGHRITVKHIVSCHQRGGKSPDQLRSGYPSLTPPAIYPALASYFDPNHEITA